MYYMKKKIIDIIHSIIKKGLNYVMNIISFLTYCIIVTFTPGPTNIVILSVVNNQGSKKAMEFTYGATVAFGLLLTFSAILNAMLSAVLPKFLPFMQIVGCVYILYLAFQILKMDTIKKHSIEQDTNSFREGLLMQFINPKVVLFTMTVIPSFITPCYNEKRIVFLFVLIITIIGFCAFMTWVLFGTIFKILFQKYQKPFNIIMALFLVYSAVMVSGVEDIFMR